MGAGMEPLSANDPPAIGEFRLHARLGAGGMGQVYLGFSPAGHAVAVKVIHPQFARDEEFLRRFSNEVAAASAVGGMYTAPVVAYDLSSAMPWLATAYVPGPTLATFISKYGPLPEPVLWRLAAGLAEALKAVHAKGLVHRDLKPANVLLADSGPHVIDFGISRASSRVTQLTSTGTAIGTPSYMSPEQAQVEQVGPASDMFSLGSVLGYAATGTPPFSGDNPATLLFRVVSIEPDLSSVPPRFRQVVEACLKKDPAQRPTPGQLIAMISQLGPATPVTLGSFWPDDVARAIATEQAAQTPAGLTPPRPFTGATSAPWAGQVSGMAGSAAAQPKHVPTALATPPRGQTGHAPMIADGYLAAAGQQSPTPPPSGPPMSAPPRAYGGQQPGWQAPPGQVPPGQAPFGPNPLGPNPFGQAPAYGTPPPAYPGQQAYPQQPGYPRQPGAGMPPYAPGRRKPAPGEVPPRVRNAVTSMYLGLAATVVNAVIGLVSVGKYVHQANVDQNLSNTSAEGAAALIVGVIILGLIADAISIGCWIWLAAATRRGQGWTRVVGTVLFGIYSIGTLFTMFSIAHAPATALATLATWGCGLAAIIFLWSQQARDFFYAWRTR